MSAPVPPDEAARLSALRATGLLGSLPEQEFDDLVTLAAQICGTPIALVSLVDESRQWFKARHGLAVQETPRDVAFCAHAILGSELLEIPDASHDPRFCANPLVTGDPEIRFYAGVPLIDAEGHALGTLCVIDRRERRLDEAQKRAIKALARQTMAQIRLHQRAHELSRLNEALCAARARADATSEARSRILAFVSHELRTPMNGVLGMAELLRDTALNLEQLELVETVRSSSQQMLHLLNQLLDFSRLEADAVDLDRRPLDPVACVDEAIELVAPGASAKGIDVHVMIDPALPPLLLADAGRLRQVLVNLLGNALKFSARGEVLVELGPDEAPGRWRVAVIDTGPGLPPDRIHTLFRPFSRLDDGGPSPGTGLGLAICKRLVELHGGSIEASNRPGRGACFSFSFQAPAIEPRPPRPLVGLRALVAAGQPSARAAVLRRLLWWGADAALAPDPTPEKPLDLLVVDGASPAPGAQPRLTVRAVDGHEEPQRGEILLRRPHPWRRALARIERHLTPDPTPGHDSVQLGFDRSLGARRPLRILLAEDNPINQRVAAKMLERFGYRVDLVADGQQVLDRVTDGAYDVVMMDLQMPGVDGFEATRALRRRGLPLWIVAMTASAFESDREACVKAGMNDYIAKPLLVADLARVLHRAASSVGASRASNPD